MMNFPVDIVYTWVDNKDPIWNEKKKEALHEININPEANEDCRFISSNELQYSIRSVYKYCSWFNKIYIITDSQVPKWLDIANNDDIIIIDHNEIFNKKGKLPTFNSNVIESRIHYIPHLCEHYIYFNDDYFIGRDLKKDFFFYNNGCPKIYMTKMKTKQKVLNSMTSEKMLKQTLYPRNLNKARKLVFDKCNKLVCNYPIHNPKAFRKSDILKVESNFRDMITESLLHQFRSSDGIYFLALCMFYLIAQGVEISVMKPYRGRRLLYNIPYFCRNRDFIYIKLGIDSKLNEKYENIFKYRPAYFCINDTKISSDSDRKSMVRFLSKYYPDRTNVEKL